MKQMSVAVVVVALGLLAGLSYTACGGKVTEKAVERAIEQSAASSGQSVDVDMSSGSMRITAAGSEEGGGYQVEMSEEGTSIVSASGTEEMVIGEKAAIPGDFPKDVPLYENMKPNVVARDSAQGLFSITATSPDPVDKVAQFFADQARTHQWTEDTTMVQGRDQMQMMTYSKANRTLTILVIRDEKGTSIQLTTSAP